MNTPLNTSPDPAIALDNDDYDTLDAILDDLRTRGEDVPQWEFCEGAMAALLCTRRLVLPDEFLPLLLGTGDSQPGVASGEEGDTWFADEAQYAQFMTLWTRRWNEVASALGANVETLEDERSYHPEVMDVRGAVAGLPEAERAEIGDQELPAFAQVWALGDHAKANMTETVRAWREYAPTILPLPHPSWRNTAWLKKNPWFEAEVLPYLRERVRRILTSANPAAIRSSEMDLPVVS